MPLPFAIIAKGTPLPFAEHPSFDHALKERRWRTRRSNLL
jgi:hypothetical protein